MHVIKRLMVNYDTPRQCLNNFNWTDFYIHFRGRYVTSKLRVFHLWQTNFASYKGVDWQYRAGLIFSITFSLVQLQSDILFYERNI